MSTFIDDIPEEHRPGVSRIFQSIRGRILLHDDNADFGAYLLTWCLLEVGAPIER